MVEVHPSSSQVPSDWPPVVSCSRCGQRECSDLQCVVRAAAPEHALPWECGGRAWHVRLWQTAVATTLEPERSFGVLPPAGLGKALLFGTLCEAIAIGSFAALALPLSVMFPNLARELWHSEQARAWLLGLLLGAVLLMLGLHLVWGICTELGAYTDQRRPRIVLGMRFGLYACGCDLLASPAGLLIGTATAGLRNAWRQVALAAYAPRPTLAAYARGRGFSRAAERRGMQYSIAAFALGLAGVILAGTYLLWRSMVNG